MLKNLSCFFILFIIALNNHAQKLSPQHIDSVLVSPMLNDTLYIREYNNRLNINLNTSNEFISYRIPFEGFNGVMKPNIYQRLAIDFNYRFATLRIGVRLKGSEEDRERRGESDYLRFRLQFIFKNWAHKWEFNRIKGYYVSNSNDLLDTDTKNKILFPEMTSYIFHGESYRKLNPRYSIKAINSQTEAQIKSAGTWMPSIDYWYYYIEKMDTYTDINGETIKRQNYKTINGFTLASFWGYHYTFVRKKFYLNSFVDIGLGYDYAYNKYFENRKGVGFIKTNNFTYGVKAGLHLGYNSDKFFFGGGVSNRIMDYLGQDQPTNALSNNLSFNIFIGHRFRAPKQVRKTVDFIDEKIPLINDKN